MQTITEALAEIATIDKRIPKKAEELIPYVAQPGFAKDPMEKSGGSARYIAEQRQSHADLLGRKLELRRQIAKANAEHLIVVGGREQSIADWLVWKRECYAPEKLLLDKLLAQAQGARAEAVKRAVKLVSESSGEPTQEDIVVHVSEEELIEEIDALETLFGTLDGLLSLKNATIVI